MRPNPKTPTDFKNVCDTIEERLRVRALTRTDIIELLADLAVLKEEVRELQQLSEDEKAQLTFRIRQLVHRVLAY